MTARIGILLLLIAGLLVAAGASHAETLWVKDEVILNVRSGPGREHQVLGAIRTGDSVVVLTRQENWTEVRSSVAPRGWIPSSYLQPRMPAALHLERRTAELSDLRERAAALETQITALRSTREENEQHDAAQQQEIERLTRENRQLKRGPRWPEWIAGASILTVGGFFGALLRRSGQRSGPRIRM